MNRRGFLALLGGALAAPAIPSHPRPAPTPAIRSIDPNEVRAMEDLNPLPTSVVEQKMYRTDAGSSSFRVIATRRPPDWEWTPIAKA